MEYNLKLQQIWLLVQDEYRDYSDFIEDHEDLDLDDLNEILDENKVTSDVKQLFHGSDEDFTDEGFDFDMAEHFSIHLGSKEQATQFGDYLYSATVDLGKGIELDDLGVWGISGLLRELKSKGVIHQQDVEDVYEREQLSEGDEALREILTDKGYGHISYTNAVECAGETSVIILSINQVSDFKCIDSPTLKNRKKNQCKP